MITSTCQRTFLIAAPLVFAALLMFHPMGGGDFYSVVSADPTRWLIVHLGAAVLFPLMACVVWLQIRGIPDRAARVSRIALPIFAVVYGAWEAVIGIATGIIAHEANATGGEAHRGIADAVNAMVTNPLVGDPGVLNAIGSLAWIVATAAAVVALKGVGTRRGALILLGLGGVMVMHIPPIGPIALVCLSAAGLLIERERPALATRARPRAVAWARVRPGATG
jgi:hypothetical protein